MDRTLTLDEYVRRYLEPACERAFGKEAMTVWRHAVAAGLDLDEAAAAALAVVKRQRE